MLKCPSCDATLDQDFGMVTCGSCQAVLMIDISGNVQVGTEAVEIPEEEEFTATEYEESTDEVFEDPLLEDPIIDEPLNEEAFEEPDETIDDTDPIVESLEDDLFDDVESGEVEASYVETDSEVESEAEPEMEEALFDEPEESVVETAPHATGLQEPGEEPDTLPETPAEPDPKPVDITEYANSRESALEDGELVYDVMVSGLDSKDLRESFKLCLLDEKLKLNHHEYLKKIKNGKVTIPDLNPLKAKRIVEQLQFNDLDITWRQKRVIMEVLEPEAEEADEAETAEEEGLGDAEI